MTRGSIPPMTDDIRGSAPALSTKDLILEIWHDTKAMKSQVDVLVSQDLNTRVATLEADKQRRDGQAGLIKALVGSSAFMGLIGVINFFKDTLHVHF